MADEVDLTALLASLENEETDEGETTDGGENNAIKQVRDHAKKLEKQLKSAAKELGELREFKQTVVADQTKATVQKAFTDAGLNEKHASLFLKVHDGEVTADAVKNFVTEYGLVPGEATDETEEPAEKSTFAPTQAASDGAAQQGTGTISRPDWLKIVGTDPAKAQKLQAAGKVDMSDVAIQSFGEAN